MKIRPSKFKSLLLQRVGTAKADVFRIMKKAIDLYFQPFWINFFLDLELVFQFCPWGLRS